MKAGFLLTHHVENLQVLAFKAEALLKLHKLQEAEMSLKAISSLPFYSQNKFCGMVAEAYVLYVQSQVDMAMGRYFPDTEFRELRVIYFCGQLRNCCHVLQV